MKIDSIISNAVLGVEKGLNDARRVSAQLATGAPKPEEEAEEPKQNGSKVEKASDAELGTIVDEQA